MEIQPNIHGVASVPAAFVVALKIIQSFFEVHMEILVQASIKDLISVNIYSGDKFAVDTEEAKETFFHQTWNSTQDHETRDGKVMSCVKSSARWLTAADSSCSITFFLICFV